MLVIYTKDDCSLCEKGAKEIKADFPDLKIEKINISSNPELLAAYKDKVPVFLWDNQVIGFLHPPLKKIQKLLAASPKIG